MEGVTIRPWSCWNGSVPGVARGLQELAGAELLLAGRHLLAETDQLVTAEDLLGLREQLLFLLLDVVPDVLHQDGDLGVEGLVLGRHRAQLAEQDLDDVVLLDRLGDPLRAVLLALASTAG